MWKKAGIILGHVICIFIILFSITYHQNVFGKENNDKMADVQGNPEAVTDVSQTPIPTEILEVKEKPTPTNTLTPTETPMLTNTPIPTVTPELIETNTPAPTVTPVSEPTPTSTPVPTEEPVPTKTPDTVVTATIVVERGNSASMVCKQMEAAGVIKEADDFRQYLISRDLTDFINIGTYEISSDMSYKEMAKIITGR